MDNESIDINVGDLASWPADQLRRAHRLLGLSVVRLEAERGVGESVDTRRQEAESVGQELLDRGLL